MSKIGTSSVFRHSLYIVGNQKPISSIALQQLKVKFSRQILFQVEGIVGQEKGLNLLINNAGILPAPAPLADLTAESMREGFEVNCLAPLFLTRALLPLLTKAADVNEVAADGRSVGRSAVVQVTTFIVI